LFSPCFPEAASGRRDRAFCVVAAMADVSNVEPTASAPPQQSMTDGKWAIPQDADPFFRNGIDWQEWNKRAPQPPQVYDPPQLRPGFLPKQLCLCLNWWNQRSPLLAGPLIPCCCAASVYKCCIPNREYVSFAEPDKWMLKMLSTGTHPNCPEEMKGIFWLSDNIAAHEHLVTFHDAIWANDKLALKSLQYNWTRGPTAFGAGLFTAIKVKGNTLRIELAPDSGWVSIAGSSGNPTWMYRPKEGETFKYPDGSTLVPEKYSLMRVTWGDDANPTSEISYQYWVRRVAYLDESGNLVKTPAYDELKRLSTQPQTYPPCCGCTMCGYCVCRPQTCYCAPLSLRDYPELPSHTVIQYAPGPPTE